MAKGDMDVEVTRVWSSTPFIRQQYAGSFGRYTDDRWQHTTILDRMNGTHIGNDGIVHYTS